MTYRTTRTSHTAPTTARASAEGSRGQHRGANPGRSTLAGRIADQLQGQILSGELASQTRLPAESELAEQLGVSRTAVRDAMQSLASRGLVTVRHGHGTAVAEPTDSVFTEAMVLMIMRSELTVGDLIGAREEIEIAVSSAAAERRTESDCEMVARAVQAFRDVVDGHRWQDAEAAHVGVHLALLAAARFPAFDILLRPMQHVIMLSSDPPRHDDPTLWEVDAHEALLAPLRSADREGLRRALSAHYGVMDPREYRAQRAGLVRDSPAMHELLSRILRHGLPDGAAGGKPRRQQPASGRMRQGRSLPTRSHT